MAYKRRKRPIEHGFNSGGLVVLIKTNTSGPKSSLTTDNMYFCRLQRAAFEQTLSRCNLFLTRSDLMFPCFIYPYTTSVH